MSVETGSGSQLAASLRRAPFPAAGYLTVAILTDFGDIFGGKVVLARIDSAAAET
jgi:hypothetical protein